ncbi:DUF4153 domain-containing protein [Mucilaginibacter aquatilis]|uniref:DUF4153 domain-containing protein n=1 Tax=Mucilaginibacter aquatilis TaxID=1517760 RepID=A0A6I4I6F7_9SPHI|nr:DUF4153 domain-containing protein [Mucilaginibacter aquatilis]MVN90671.1 DUF4153 domain-containing protein [Mucilaginibacter aquatilis]
MKFISLKNLVQGAAAVLKRFPLEVLFALTGTVAAIVNIELNSIDYDGQGLCWRLITGANLGLLLSLSATLYSESHGLSKGKLWLLRLLAVLLTCAITWSINPFEQKTDILRFLLLSFAFHLLVAFAAFTKGNTVQSFWQFNKTLFLRFLTSALYSAVLFIGLAAAIGAINFLFNANFEWDTFATLWVLIVGLFSTTFFLAGVPASTEALNEDYSYPKGLKIFTQYVLIPLATVYVIILLAYEGKILISWQLPKGLVSSLILGYAVFGILSNLLVYPIRNQDDNKWIKTFSKSFYLLLLPLIVLLFVATGTRVFTYGVTELRYFLVVLAFWLLFISIYFLISKKQNIKLIPISLCLLTLVSVYGPLSAFNVAKMSQLRILKDIFIKNKAFSNLKFKPVSNSISKRDGNHAVAVIDYLVSQHDITVLQPYFKKDLKKVSDSLIHKNNSNTAKLHRYEAISLKLEWVKKQLNLEKYWGYWRDEDTEGNTYAEDERIGFTIEEMSVIDIKGYDYLVNDLTLNGSPDTLKPTTIRYKINNTEVKHIDTFRSTQVIQIGNESASFELEKWANEILADTASLKKLENTEGSSSYISSYTLPQSKLTITRNCGKHVVTLRLTQVNLNKPAKGKRFEITYALGAILIKW